MERFAGKIAVVTGAASGLGRATAVRLAEEGASVACLDVAHTGAAETASGLAGKALAVECDVADESAVGHAVSQVASELGALDVLCNVAGIGRFAHTTELDLVDWHRILDVNLTGTFLMCRAALPHLLETGGNIVNIASTAGIVGQPYSAAYCASKGGVIMLTKALATEYIKRGVRVNAVAPGGMATPMLQQWGFPEGATVEDFARITSPMGYSQPEQVATAVAYVASDEADYMTGSVVTVDGGITM